MKRQILVAILAIVLIVAAGCAAIGQTDGAQNAATTVKPGTTGVLIFPTTKPVISTTLPTFSGNATEPTTPPTEPVTSPAEPTTPPTEPTAPPTEPTIPPTEPTVPPTEPTMPPTEPTMPPTEPTAPPTEPTAPPTEPITPPTEPTVPPTEPTVPTVKEELDVGTLWVANVQTVLNVRAGASLTAKTIAVVSPDTLIQVLAWKGKFALVRVDGVEGYAYSSYLRPADHTYVDKVTDTIGVTDSYSYESMMEDLETLSKQHPDQIEVEIIGTSELGRPIPVVRMGQQDAQYHVLIHASIHGREHMTSWLVMAMLDYWSEREISRYGDVCWHIIPMVNPDGVTISQTAQIGEKQAGIYADDKKQGYANYGKTHYLENWKANGLGIDLNRNFPAGWEYLEINRTGPSSMNYQGSEPFCAAESRMLRDYTLRNDFDVTISYHATGSVIYYEYGDSKQVNALSKRLGKVVSNLTGYTMWGSHAVGAGGYKDWAIETMGIPSLTIEIGCDSAPLPERELYSILVRNLRVMPEIAAWMQEALQ